MVNPEIEKLKEQAENNGIELLKFNKHIRNFQHLFRCKTCGQEFEKEGRSFMDNPKCKYCDTSSKLVNIEDRHKRLKALYKDEYTILEFEDRIWLKLRHNVCGNISRIKWNSINLGIIGCKVCSGKNKHSIKEVSEFAKQENYELLSTEYRNTESKLLFKCNTCNNTFEMSYHNFKGGCRCPFCFRFGNRSKGIEFIRSILSELGISFEEEYKYNRYAYDLFIPKYDLLIEFDGEQHFKEKRFTDNEEKLVEVMKRDFIKNFIAKNLLKKDILRIDYTMTLKSSNLKVFLKKLFEERQNSGQLISNQASISNRRRLNDYRTTSEGRNLVEYAISMAEMEGFHLTMEEDIVWSLAQ